MFFGTQL